MARNKQHLTGRQAKFLNTLAQGRMTVEQVERHLGLACYTLRRWMDQKPFLEAWAKTNTLLQLRRGADDAILGKPADDQPNAAPSPVPVAIAAARSTGDEDASDSAEGDRPAPRRGRERPAPQPKSDRDLIRLRHGEEAARMFDDLLRRHAPPAPSHAPEPVPPPGDIVVQPFQAAPETSRGPSL